MKRPELDAPWRATFATLPPDLLLNIFGLLSARDLAAVSMQGTYQRHMAADPKLWEPLALARWPGTEAERQYGGDWHRLFMARAPLPHAFPLAADRIRTITVVQQQRHAEQQQAVSSGREADAPASSTTGCRVCSGGSVALLQHVAFEDVMQQTFVVGLACTKDRAVKRTTEWRDMKQDLTWWATQRPEVVVAFIRSTHEGLEMGGHDGWGGGVPRGWNDTPWRRSAVAFLQDLGLLTGAHASVVNRIAAEASALDRAIRSVQRETTAVAVGPHGIPPAHWWFN